MKSPAKTVTLRIKLDPDFMDVNAEQIAQAVINELSESAFKQLYGHVWDGWKVYVDHAGGELERVVAEKADSYIKAFDERVGKANRELLESLPDYALTVPTKRGKTLEDSMERTLKNYLHANVDGHGKNSANGSQTRIQWLISERVDKLLDQYAAQALQQMMEELRSKMHPESAPEESRS